MSEPIHQAADSSPSRATMNHQYFLANSSMLSSVDHFGWKHFGCRAQWILQCICSAIGHDYTCGKHPSGAPKGYQVQINVGSTSPLGCYHQKLLSFGLKHTNSPHHHY